MEECDDGNSDHNDGCFDCHRLQPLTPAEALTLPERGEWAWYEIEDTQCRNGSASGFSIRPGALRDHLVFYFEGGGACFEAVNCSLSPSRISEHRRTPKEEGIFEPREANPFRDWTIVYFPYCTGDAFAGTRPRAPIEGFFGRYNFVGALNMSRFLSHLVSTFPEATEIFSAGESAGGLAAIANAKVIERAFPGVTHTVLSDSAPPLPSTYLAPCLQDLWARTWGLDKSILPDCGAHCDRADDYILDLTIAVSKTSHVGIFSFEADPIIRTLYKLGDNDCALSAQPPITEEAMEQGLDDLRETLIDENTLAATYYTSGTQHRCIQSDCFYTMVTNGVPLTHWVQSLRAGNAGHVGG